MNNWKFTRRVCEALGGEFREEQKLQLYHHHHAMDTTAILLTPRHR